jgi:hypothetical protein
MDFIEIEILNWAKHQPRKDIKHPTWFALSNRIMEDAKLFGLTSDDWRALIYIFCQASQQNSASVKINFAHAQRICDISKKQMLSAISRLCDVGVTCTVRANTDTLRDTTLQDTTEQNRTNTTVCTVVETTSAPTEILSADDLTLLLSDEVKSLYRDDPEYVEREAIKAWAWIKNNPKKSPKKIRGFRTFFSGWLDRGWERHRKALPSAKPHKFEWEATAKTILDAVIAAGSGSSAAADRERALGPELHQLAIKAGIQRIRDVKRDAFQLKNIAEMLKRASEVLDVAG